MTRIHDVAKHAGVSIATVSRVLNRNDRVSSDVKKRVEEAMETLAYRPNAAARSLRTNRSRVIALLVSDIQNPFFIDLIRGVEDEAQRHDFSLILCNSSEKPQREQQYLDVLYAEHVAGTIIVPTREQPAEESLKRFHERRIPIVSVDRRVKDKRVDAVLVDNVRGAREAVSHLVTNGYKHIGAITGPTTVTTGIERLEGYRQALREAGLPLDPHLERTGTFSTQSGYVLAEELLNVQPPVSALFVGNNLMTLGALNAIRARGLRIPEDVALVGYDDVQWPDFDTVSITAVTQPVYELGRAAALRLFQRLDNLEIESRQEIILAPTLQVRGSSQPRAVMWGSS